MHIRQNWVWYCKTLIHMLIYQAGFSLSHTNSKTYPEDQNTPPWDITVKTKCRISVKACQSFRILFSKLVVDGPPVLLYPVEHVWVRVSLYPPREQDKPYFNFSMALFYLKIQFACVNDHVRHAFTWDKSILKHIVKINNITSSRSQLI